MFFLTILDPVSDQSFSSDDGSPGGNRTGSRGKSESSGRLLKAQQTHCPKTINQSNNSRRNIYSIFFFIFSAIK